MPWPISGSLHALGIQGKLNTIFHPLPPPLATPQTFPRRHFQFAELAIGLAFRTIIGYALVGTILGLTILCDITITAAVNAMDPASLNCPSLSWNEAVPLRCRWGPFWGLHDQSIASVLALICSFCISKYLPPLLCPQPSAIMPS